MASCGRMLVLTRQFSTTNPARAGLVKPPLAVFGIPGRYATALFSAASKEKKLDAVEKDLLKFKGLIEQDKRLAQFVDDPLIKKSLKRDALSEALKKQQFNALTINFVGALCDNGRARDVRGVINAFSRIMGAVRGELLCEVVTAKPLDAAAEKDLEAALQMFLKKGQVLLISKKVDPSILGGMLVSIGDKFVDMSISSKVKAYTALLKQAV
uniref:Oligomycin sensitivity conferral protein n=1 Tax=Ixodes ricinus TaxID=34613 RepID=A0A131Y9A9_IXORI